MKTTRIPRTNAGFTLVEIMVSVTITVLVTGMALGIFFFGLRAMYKDTQRLATNASLRSFMAQISKETLDASYFYIFRYHTKLDGNIDLTADPLIPQLVEDGPDDEYDKYVAHGDCLVLVTKTSRYRTTDIRQIRVYYRVTANQTQANAEAPLRYFATADWTEGSPDDGNASTDDGNGHPLGNLTTYLNAIDLNSNPAIAGSRVINARTRGRAVDSPYTGYAAGDLYPMFSSEAPSANPTNGYIAINIEFINGTTVNNLLSSSSFNYTISPRK